VRLLGGLVLAAVLLGCTPKAALIPPRAAVDLNCPQDQVQVLEKDNAGDTGEHYAIGCGKRTVYMMNPFGEWVITGPIVNDPSHVTLPPPPER